MMLKVKRVYDEAKKSDGYRVLVDRLWPRGMQKKDVNIDAWAKELTPSKELFTWFHTDKEERFAEFQKQYRKELAGKKEIFRALIGRRKRITLITSVKDIRHSHIPVLRSFLEKIT